jgi:hypothetical protein
LEPAFLVGPLRSEDYFPDFRRKVETEGRGFICTE